MSKQYLLIHNFPALYEILNELKNSLSFSIRIIDDIKESYVLFHSNFSQLRLVKIVLYENTN